ncbi:hypothetical protein M6B38_133080 [Iris pallida]|uniref:Uncharacterized protein n=1 Tax=Iris pallida TaxID=29817 RepID=A0AAX6FGC7_IRIPA|nr:hypothetical protein M6B38_133080 [Iris pallida]
MDGPCPSCARVKSDSLSSWCECPRLFVFQLRVLFVLDRLCTYPSEERVKIEV